MGRSDPIKSIGLNVKVYLYDADKNGQFIHIRSREVSQNRLIYQKKGQCNTKSKCEWKLEEENEKKCLDFSDKQNCLEDPDCYYDKDTCLPKGLCVDA